MRVEATHNPGSRYNPFLLQLLARELDERRFLEYVGLVVQKLDIGKRYSRSEIVFLINEVLQEIGMNPRSVETVICKFYNDLRRLYIIRAGSPEAPWSRDDILAEPVEPIVSLAKAFKDPHICGAIAILNSIYLYINDRIQDRAPCLYVLTMLLSDKGINDVIKAIRNGLESEYRERGLSFNEDRARAILERMHRLVKLARDLVKDTMAKIMVPLELWEMIHD